MLDLGAGEGAFSLRLKDNGYHVEAVELKTSIFKPDGIRCTALDLNDGGAVNDFSARKKASYDAVIALELIEHLENPWRLMRLCKTLVKPGGLVLITTPNVASFMSRFAFLRTGVFPQFTRADAESYGHINPIAPFELEYISESIGLKIIEKQPAGMLPLLWFGPWGFKSNLMHLLAGLLYPFMRGEKDGWCLVYLFRSCPDD